MEEKFTVVMSFDEILAVKKMIGKTSRKQRLEDFELTIEQDLAAMNIYDTLDAIVTQGQHDEP